MKVTTSRHPQVPKDFSLAEGETASKVQSKTVWNNHNFQNFSFHLPACLHLAYHGFRAI